MASILRFRKLCYVEPVRSSSLGFRSFETLKVDNKEESVVSKVKNKLLEKKKNTRQSKEWRCIDHCCWIIGYMFTTWWLLLFLYHCLPTTLPGFRVLESPGTRLKREGLTALHPVVLVPGIVTGGLELWEGRPCANGLFRKRLWGGSFAEIFKRFACHILLNWVIKEFIIDLGKLYYRFRKLRLILNCRHFFNYFLNLKNS